MAKTNGPNANQLEMTVEAVRTLIVSVGSCREYGDARKHSRAEALHDRLVEHVLRIQGNRSGTLAPTWDDLRLMLAHVFRECLAELEKK